MIIDDVLPKIIWLKGPKNGSKWPTNLNDYFLLQHRFNHHLSMLYNFCIGFNHSFFDATIRNNYFGLFLTNAIVGANDDCQRSFAQVYFEYQGLHFRNISLTDWNWKKFEINFFTYNSCCQQVFLIIYITVF